MIGSLDNLDEGLRFKGSATNQAAIHVRLGQEFLGVLLVHGPAVLDGDAPGHPGAVEAADGGADVGADLAGLLGGGGLAGADGPDGLIGDDAAAQLVGGDAEEGALHLQGDPFGGDAGLPLLQALAHADDGDQAGLDGGVDLLVHGEVGLVVVAAALGVADDDVLGPRLLDHVGGNLAGVGAVVQLVAGLGADGDVAVLEQPDGGLDVHGGDAQHHVAPLALGHDGLDLLGKGLGLGQGVVHLPVAGNDCFAVTTIHSIHSSDIF